MWLLAWEVVHLLQARWLGALQCQVGGGSHRLAVSVAACLSQGVDVPLSFH
jgi:hypothetical protein